jgi:triosephosphate isomerase
MATRVPIVGGNWKCNAGKGLTSAVVDTLVTGLNSLPEPKCEVYVAPPAIYIDKVNSAMSSTFNVSAQNEAEAQLRAQGQLAKPLPN